MPLGREAFLDLCWNLGQALGPFLSSEGKSQLHLTAVARLDRCSQLVGLRQWLRRKHKVRSLARHASQTGTGMTSSWIRSLTVHTRSFPLSTE